MLFQEFAKNQKQAGTCARTAELSGRGVPSRWQRSISARIFGVHLLERDVADALLWPWWLLLHVCGYSAAWTADFGSERAESCALA